MATRARNTWLIIKVNAFNRLSDNQSIKLHIDRRTGILYIRTVLPDNTIMCRYFNGLNNFRPLLKCLRRKFIYSANIQINPTKIIITINSRQFALNEHLNRYGPIFSLYGRLKYMHADYPYIMPTTLQLLSPSQNSIIANGQLYYGKWTHLWVFAKQRATNPISTTYQGITYVQSTPIPADCRPYAFTLRSIVIIPENVYINGAHQLAIDMPTYSRFTKSANTVLLCQNYAPFVNRTVVFHPGQYLSIEVIDSAAGTSEKYAFAEYNAAFILIDQTGHTTPALEFSSVNSRVALRNQFGEFTQFNPAAAYVNERGDALDSAHLFADPQGNIYYLNTDHPRGWANTYIPERAYELKGKNTKPALRTNEELH